MDVIKKYFPHLNVLQEKQFEALGLLYPDWNDKINVISRKDIDNLYVNHILHSLAIAKFLDPVPGTTFMDLGTGGGFPGIPLAILWPECRFHLVDRIGKKLKVAQSIAETIGLENVTFQHGDVSECKEKFDFVISRAVYVKLVNYNACGCHEPLELNIHGYCNVCASSGFLKL